MILYLVRYNPSGQAKQPKIYDIANNPAPTVLAGGIAGDNLSHYWIQWAENKDEIIRSIKERENRKHLIEEDDMDEISL